MNTPGKEGTSFKITLDKFDFGKENIERFYPQLEVVSKPIRHRYQWYWRILYYLTLGVFFWEYYTYEVKIKK